MSRALADSASQFDASPKKCFLLIGNPESAVIWLAVVLEP